jgi:CheY-like chemotaxis protein
MVWVRCSACHGLIFRDPGGPPVVVAHESDTIAQQIGLALVDAGFAPIRVARGRDAVRLIEAQKPPAVVLDVALTDTMSFQVIEHIRASAELRAVKVVLVASVFNRTAYKRRPESLHGADGYVEQHHITDHLPERLSALLGLPAPSSSHRMGADIRQRIIDGEARTDLAGGERVRALARSIVADIALYHEADFRRAAAGREVAELKQALAEGRRLLGEMVNVEDLGDLDPIGAAYDEILRTMEAR